MVVVSIVAILGAVAVPSFHGLTAGQRIKTAAFDLHTDLTLARSEAIKRNTTVTVAQNTGGWSKGWSVAVGDATLKSRDITSGTLSIAGSTASITFNGAGRPTAPFQATAADMSVAVASRCIKLDLSGRPSTRSEACEA
jgi:type IV fimbrial biogenesis protein FimT